MTLEEFLDWESRQELKYEFDGFQPVGMVGVTVAHSLIQGNLLALSRLRGHRCRAHGSDVKIQVAGRIRYPNAFIVCSPIERDATVVHDPVVVFEILSPGTSYTDRIEKNQEYRATRSIQQYVILEQARLAATIHRRVGENWLTDVLIAEGELAISELGFSVPLAEIYEGVKFPPDIRPAESD
jgi:Uma2 family endonuclease